MTPDELSNLDSDADHYEWRSKQMLRAIKIIADGDEPFLAFEEIIFDHGLRVVIESAINEFKDDLVLFLFEIARRERAKAKLKRDMVSSYVTPTEGL